MNYQKPQKYLKQNLSLLFGFVVLIWIIEFINFRHGHSLCYLGIYPRTLEGLRGISFFSFLHTSVFHALLNTIPLVILGGLASFQEKSLFSLSVFIILGSGIALFCFGRSFIHLGATALFHGYYGFLVVYGFYKKNNKLIFVSNLTIFIYNAIIPVNNSLVSWESHLFGVATGLVAGKLLSFKKPDKIIFEIGMEDKLNQ